MAKVTGVEFGNDGFGISIGGGSDGFNTARSDYRKRLRQYYPNLKRGAEAAGVHPLWAMGAAPNLGSQPVPVGSGQSAGFRAKVRKPEESAVDTAMAKYYNALADDIIAKAKTDADENVSDQNSGQVRVQPKTLTTHEPGKDHQTPGKEPAWNRFSLSPDLTLNVPAESLDSVWESPSIWIPILDNTQNQKAIIEFGVKRFIRAVETRWPALKSKYRDEVIRYLKERWGTDTVKTSPVRNPPKGNTSKPGYYREMYKGRTPRKYYNPYAR